MSGKKIVVTHKRGSSIATVRPYGSSSVKTVSYASLSSEVKNRLKNKN
jgi:hypothetical protein